MSTDYLNQIQNPEDLKRMPESLLPVIAQEIRDALYQRFDVTGGHFGSNLGTVELEIAMHYVFDSPKDKFVFDVSHQAYTHKILTGRKAFVEPGEYLKYSGYTNQDESEHDHFKIDHTSTSISLATGLAKARDLRGGKENIVAVIGDGSMSGGEAFEGLNNAAMLGSNFIVIFNDNEMSIAVPQGGMYANFAELRRTRGTCENNFFKAMEMDYLYVEYGNDFTSLLAALRSVKDIDHPVVLHVHTQKGYGSAWAKTHQEECHWVMPKDFMPQAGPNINSITADFLMKKIEEDPSVIAVNAATPGAMGLTQEWRKKAGKQFVDVGIAEEHAVAFISGLAKGGARPVFLVFGSFLQRTCDQLMQDLALNRNPAVILVYDARIGSGDATHNGTYATALEHMIPNVKVFSPYLKEDYLQILGWAMQQREFPVIINVPDGIHEGEAAFDADSYGSYHVVKDGQDAAMIGFGKFRETAERTAELLEQKGVHAMVVDPLISGTVDFSMLSKIKDTCRVVATMEDGMLQGGTGREISAYYSTSPVKVLNFGAEKEYLDRVGDDAMLEQYSLKPEQIAAQILKELEV